MEEVSRRKEVIRKKDMKGVEGGVTEKMNKAPGSGGGQEIVIHLQEGETEFLSKLPQQNIFQNCVVTLPQFV